MADGPNLRLAQRKSKTIRSSNHFMGCEMNRRIGCGTGGLLVMKLERAWMFAAACSLFAVQFMGCGTDPNPTTGSSSSSGSSGEAGAGGTGGTSTSSSSSSGTPPECTAATDCKNNGVADFCGEPECSNGKCGRKGLQAPGTPLPSQLYGDCLEKQCDATFNIVDVNKDNDVYNDVKECTTDVCTNGVLSHDLVAQGTLCNKPDGSSGVCDGAGSCFSCLDGVQGCTGNFTCQMNKCVKTTCTNNMKDPGEGDTDCGVGCLPCADGKTCTQAAQCASGSCMAGTCAAPACPDGLQNGKETDVDCGGGDCSKCATDQLCTVATDCQNGVCKDGFCLAPTCTDAVQNGDEAGIDCGGTCPTPCP